MDPMTIAMALLGAGVGAAKTVSDKKSRKNPASWISNVGGGMASGATGGISGALGPSLLQGGVTAEGTPGDTLPPIEGPEIIQGGISKGGGPNPVWVDLLKSYIGRNKVMPAPAAIPEIRMPEPMPNPQITIPQFGEFPYPNRRRRY